MRINDEVDTNKDELLDERQSTGQKPKRDRNIVLSHKNEAYILRTWEVNINFKIQT